MRTKVNLLFLISFFFISTSTIAQYGNPSDNSTIASEKLIENRENIKNAHLAFLSNDFVKMKYHLFRSQKDGFRTKDFFYLLGVYSYFEKDLRMCKEYWRMAYKKNYWECKEYIEKVKKNEPLEDILKANSENYLKEETEKETK